MYAKKRRLESRLDARKRRAALMLVANDFVDGDERKKQSDIADEIGISRKCLWEWKTQNKDFIEYMNLIADDFLSSERSLVYRQLLRLVKGNQPSVKAIDLYLRRHGLLTDRQVVENTENSSDKSNESIEQSIAELDELLDEE